VSSINSIRQDPRWILLPLRAYLAVAFTYAGISKIADRSFLDSSSPDGMHATLLAVRDQSPIGGLLGPVEHHSFAFGLLMGLGEIAVGIGLLLGLATRIAAAGGIVIQAFPHTSEAAIAALEERIREAPPLSTLIEKMPIEDVVAQVLAGFDYKQLDSSLDVPLEYRCPCTRERAIAPLALFSPEELQEMIEEGGSEVVCQFCGRKYQITAEELLTLTARHEA